MSNEVNIFNEQNFMLENFSNLALPILNQTLLETNQDKNINYEIAVIFIDEKLSIHLNQTYRKKSYTADVLSFGNDDEGFYDDVKNLGDIYICYPKALLQATENQHNLTRELSFLFLHGLLHNLGYDHEKKEDEIIMFDLQKVILNKLKIFR